jgi:tetratricopeptide (TPR) repeat protein
MVSSETATRWMSTGTDGLAGNTSTIPRVSKIPPPQQCRWSPRRIVEWGGVIPSRRVLVLGFLLIAAFLTTRGWLRPQLSGDVLALSLPLHPEDPDSDLAERLLHGPRRIRIGSIGTVMLAAILPGMVVAVWQPRRMPTVAGLLLSGALAANAAVVLNYPGLIELLDIETEQWQRLVTMMGTVRPDDALAHASNARVAASRALNGRVSAASVECQERASLFRGWIYLKYGFWLVPWAALGHLFWSRGSLDLRLGRMGLYTALGVVLAGLACERRLHAEVYWESAKRLEARCDFEAARRALDQAFALFPEFERLERTWLLVGKLDLHQGWETPQAQFFRAYQWDANRARLHAVALMTQLIADESLSSPAPSHQTARILTKIGRDAYLQGGSAGAQFAWSRALEMDPARLDSSFFLGMSRAYTHRHFPEAAEAAFAPLLNHVADRALLADCLSFLGDSYFESGRMETARKRYASSRTAFSLPKSTAALKKVINYHAMKGLGGL